MRLEEGTLGGEKHEVKKSFSRAAFSARDETALSPSDNLGRGRGKTVSSRNG